MTASQKNPLEDRHRVSIAPLNQRRFWVLGTVVGYAALLLGAALEWTPLLVLGSIVALLAGLKGVMSVANLPQRRNSVLDECLFRIRDSAYRTAYRLLDVLVALFLLFLLLQPPVSTPPSMLWFALIVAFFFLLPVLPALVVAWTHPDPLEEL